MHIIIMSKTSSRLSHIDCHDPSHDRVIESIVLHKVGFLRRVKHPMAVCLAYIHVLVVLAPVDCHQGMCQI